MKTTKNLCGLKIQVIYRLETTAQGTVETLRAPTLYKISLSQSEQGAGSLTNTYTHTQLNTLPAVRTHQAVCATANELHKEKETL